MERIAGLDNLPRAWRMRYRIFIGIILISALCYCAGFTALALAPSRKISLVTETPTATANATIPLGIGPSPSPTQIVPPTFTPSPTPWSTGTSTSTPTPTFTFTPTATDTPAPSPTPAPTDTLAPTATPVTEPLTYTLLVAKRGDDSLFVINETATAFPLGRLRLGDGQGAIDGAEWGIDALENGECVTAWKEGGNPRPPRGVTCTQVGARLTRDGPSRFWKSAFDVYYGGEQIGNCRDDRCVMTIIVR